MLNQLLTLRETSNRKSFSKHNWVFNDNLNNKALDVNQILSKIMKEVEVHCTDHKNINPQTHLNKRKLYLNQSRTYIMSENLVIYFKML